jgi:CubicO group peptidase (beta-lactamase class C family)
MKRLLPLVLLLAPGSVVEVLLFGALFLCAATLLGQVPLTPLDAKQLASIDDFVNHEMSRQRIPGLEVGVYSRGDILLAKGYGLANVELNVPVKAETLMQSGSVGKQFVSAAIMMLVEGQNLSR